MQLRAGLSCDLRYDLQDGYDVSLVPIITEKMSVLLDLQA
jgi:hypothetical protein